MMIGASGDFDSFAAAFPNEFVPTVIELILKEWPNASRPESNPIENRITNRFVGHLQNVVRREHLPFLIQYRAKLADANSDSESGEIDILFRTISIHQDAILIIECKRLNTHVNGKFASQAGEYVGEEGMGCFVSGQYKCGGNNGVMLGYVMSRSIIEAIQSINDHLKIHKTKLQLKSPYQLKESLIIPNNPHVKQTTHKIMGGDFEILHLFVAF